MDTTYVGIDFGTSNTTVGICGGSDAELLPIENDHRTIPSAIFFDFEDTAVHFGRRAVAHYLSGSDGRFMRALKSILGTSLVNQKTVVRHKAVPFAAILGCYFSNLKSQIEKRLNHQISDVVLGRPVRFVDADDAADADAQRSLEAIAREQGFKNIEFQYEPIAAALDYEQGVSREELVLIADIGGGTSDFSIVRVSPDRRRKCQRGDDVLANEGIHIGGTDFDRLLSLRSVMPHLGLGSYTADQKRVLPSQYFHDLATWHRINQLYGKSVLVELRQVRYEAERRDLVDRLIRIVEQRQGHALASVVEQAKMELTNSPATIARMESQGEWATFRVTQSELNDAIVDSVERIVLAVKRLLRDAGVRPDGIETILLTGGSSMVPAVRNGILTLLPKARVAESDILGSVGMGLSLDARRKFS